MGAFPHRLFLKAAPIAVAVSVAVAVAPSIDILTEDAGAPPSKAVATTKLASADAHLLHAPMPQMSATELSNLEHRVSVMDGLAMFVASPIFGGGVGVYLQRRLEQTDVPLIIHSTPVWLLAETGLIGFLAFAIPFGRVLAQEWRRRIDDDFAAQMLVPLLVAFAATSLFHELLYQRAFWLLFGAGIASNAFNGSTADGTLGRHLTALRRWLTGRCTRCGARRWMARHDGYTVSTPICGSCGHAPLACDCD
jgi:hypothetical protein